MLWYRMNEDEKKEFETFEHIYKPEYALGLKEAVLT